jgi:sphingolipid delta-4 desaturase
MSYYGPLNPILFNVGYHVEHHDFPYIPHTKLPELKRIAGEYYDHLPYHTSWVKVIWDFIFDREMGPHARGVGYLPEGKSEVDISEKKTQANNNENHRD